MGRLFKVKRIIALICCTLLLSMSIFMSYSMAVHADDDYNLKDAVYNVLDIAAIIGGILAAPETGGMSLIMTAKGILDIADDAENIYKYVTSNGDGTYTIDADFIQSVVDAAIFMENQGFTDKNIEQQNSGYLYKYRWSVNMSYMYNHPYNGAQHKEYRNIVSAEKIGRVAGLKLIKSGTYTNGRNYTDISCSVKDKNGTINGIGDYIFITDGNIESQGNNHSGSAMYGFTLTDGSQSGDSYSGNISYGGNFPIFTDQEVMQHYLDTGQGYKNAENYRPTPLFRKHSSYSPTYTGGSVTVNRTVINNINTKITEVDADVSLSDDQKIEILQQYILSGGVNPTPTPPPGPTDPDYDDNKDLPSGTDLTDTNSWLKKIYLKVCQIYAKINDVVGEAEKTALDKIQESLDEIISQLKQIKGWTIADTIVDAADAVADWADFIKDLLTDADSGVATISSTMNGATNLLKTKFPFCIPWDVYFLVSFLAHEPETPVFHLPLKLERLGIDESIEVDMSQFQVVSDISRTLLTLIYCYALLNLTMKIFPMTKEET